ncbi:MAG: Ig-like domain-containing protein [bacterium]|nr:MAG: Ig-like domain-containing protein [bacterium]
MKRYTVIVSFILFCLLMMNCDESGDNVIGSRNHDIETAYATEPEILANGISTARIIANVRNNNGSIAPNMKVHFETSCGTIEEYGISNYSGNAEVTLTSAASDTDLTAEITATVLDTTFSPLEKNSANPYIITLSVPDFKADPSKLNKLKKTVQQPDYRATIYIKFLGVKLNAELDETDLPADGISKAKVQVEIRETTSFRPIKNGEIHAYANYGSIVGDNATDENGRLEFYLVADDQAGDDTLNIEYADKFSMTFAIQYVDPTLTIVPRALQVPADGQSKIQIVAHLLSHRNTPIQQAEIKFSTTAGMIPESATTNSEGNAIVDLIASSVIDSSVVVTAKFHSLRDSAIVSFVASTQVIPNSILLNADPNFIWVKETGNIDQTVISATVLGINNQPLGNDIKVKFYIVNSPGGGESIEPSSGSAMESNIISTVNGAAQATIRSGIRSGAIQIKAELVDFPDIVSQTTNIVIRSGPPYMWIDPNDANNVIPHATLAVECGKHNVAFANPIQDIAITTYFGDKYNNPIEKGTAVYFTTTGGIITSDALTNERGQTSVVLQNIYPFPYLVSNDPNQFTSLHIPNPNNETLMLDVEIPDFEFGEVINSIGTTNENDGMAVILAYTWGQDQDGNHIKVWMIARVIFSHGVARFTAVTDKTELGIGESATIDIRLYDIHGNPVAAGSSLTVATNVGELSNTNLLPSADQYGFGGTYFRTSLTNTLNPDEDEPTTAVVKIELNSPNGTGKKSIPINLKITP